MRGANQELKVRRNQTRQGREGPWSGRVGKEVFGMQLDELGVFEWGRGPCERFRRENSAGRSVEDRWRFSHERGPGRLNFNIISLATLMRDARSR